MVLCSVLFEHLLQEDRAGGDQDITVKYLRCLPQCAQA